MTPLVGERRFTANIVIKCGISCAFKCRCAVPSCLPLYLKRRSWLVMHSAMQASAGGKGDTSFYRVCACAHGVCFLYGAEQRTGTLEE